MSAYKEKKNSLAVKNPELSKQWHPTKNGDLTPNNVTMGSNKKVWWKCEKGHIWETKINNRTQGSGCPYCSGQRVCDDNSLQALNPELSKQWHPTKNGDLTPNNFTMNSSKKVWWKCKKGHEWEAAINNRNWGTGCPYCYGRLAHEDSCLQILNPELSKQWHPTKNGDLTPNDVTTGSRKKVWWKCKKGHEWEAAIVSRNGSGSGRGGSGCPFCLNKRVCKDNCLHTLNPKLSKQWHTIKNRELTPKDVVAGSVKKVWWKCEKGHEWEAQVNNRTNGRGCPYCCNKENKKL